MAGLFSTPKAPKAPDLSGVAAASEQSAKYSYKIAKETNQIGREQLQFNKDMWADQQEIVGQIIDVQLPMLEMQAEMAGEAMEMQAWAMERQMELYEQGMISSQQLQGQQLGIQSAVANAYMQGLGQQMRISEENHQLALEDRDRYERIFQPIEEDLVQEFLAYDTEGRKSLKAGEAQSDVARAQDAQRKQAMMSLESYGVDPSQTRSQALDASLRTQQASAQAAAGNQARENVENTGRALRAESINIGRGLPSNVAQSYGLALQGASGAAAPSYNVGAGAAGMQVAGNALNSIQSGANSMMGNLNNTMSGLGNNAAAWQGASQMMGSPGSWFGAGNNAMGTGNQAVGQWGNTLNTGFNNQMQGANFNANNSMINTLGPLASMGLGTAAMFMSEGGEVQGPGGPKEDAIPAQLSDGEYVIPAEVVRKKGTDFFDKLKDKAQQELAEEAQQQALQQQEAQMRQQALQAPPAQPPQLMGQPPQAMGYAGGGPVYPYDGPAPAAGAPVYYAEGGPVQDGMATPAAQAWQPMHQGTYQAQQRPQPWQHQAPVLQSLPSQQQNVVRYAEGGPVYDGASGYAPGRQGQVYEGTYWREPVQSFAEGGEAKSDKLWSGANPRPMFGYKSASADRGLMEQQARQGQRRELQQRLAQEIQDRKWQRAGRGVVNPSDYEFKIFGAPGGGAGYTGGSSTRTSRPKPEFNTGKSLSERIEERRAARAAQEAAAAPPPAPAAPSRPPVTPANEIWRLSPTPAIMRGTNYLDPEGVYGPGRSSQRYGGSPTLAYDPFGQADRLRGISGLFGGGSGPSYSSLGLD